MYSGVVFSKYFRQWKLAQRLGNQPFMYLLWGHRWMIKYADWFWKEVNLQNTLGYIVLCWNLFCSCLVLSLFFFFVRSFVLSPYFFLSSPICHFPISCLMTAGCSSIITFTELSANVRGNSILLNHRESGLEKLQNIQKLARWLLL